jgi:hypothetical protein
VDEVFDLEELAISDLVRNYQLIRGVLAASATGGSFASYAMQDGPISSGAGIR